MIDYKKFYVRSINKINLLFLVFLISCWNFVQADNCSPQLAEYKRFVSLAPSNTELIYALGSENKLVGVSSVCDYPAQVKEKTKVGSFTTANFELLAKVQPQVILLVNGQEVLASMLKKKGYEVVTFNNHRISDISGNLLSLGCMIGKKEEALALSNCFNKNINDLVKILSDSSVNEKKIFFCVWSNPLITIGQQSFINDAIKICGGNNLSKDILAAYPHYSLEKLFWKQPDIIIMPQEVSQQNFWKRPPWSNLKAVKSGQIYFLPKIESDSLNRPTLRIINGLYWLALRLHPEKESAIKKWFEEAKSISKK